MQLLGLDRVERGAIPKFYPASPLGGDLRLQKAHPARMRAIWSSARLPRLVRIKTGIIESQSRLMPMSLHMRPICLSGIVTLTCREQRAGVGSSCRAFMLRSGRRFPPAKL